MNDETSTDDSNEHERGASGAARITLQRMRRTPPMNDYPDDWSAIARRVKQRADWHCIRCGHAHDAESWHILTVHHLVPDKSLVRWWNLTALCQRCHLHIQGKVVMSRTWMFEHSEWFRPYVAGYYAWQHDLPDNREFVREHQQKLIALGQGRADLSELQDAVAV